MEPASRRLAAILAADVVGYSRMMSEDEAQTLSALRSLRSDVVEPTVGKHRGVVVKSLGDGWLVSFDSAVDAVRCAMAIQESLADEPLMQLRIGVHMGDVTHVDGDIFGDGVNIAARLEGLASPRGIAISDSVRSSLDGTLRPSFSDAGLHELKNIAEPVRIWAFGDPPATTGSSETPAPASKRDQSSLAILDFEATNAAPDVVALAEGVRDDLTTELSRFRWLHVASSGVDQDARYHLGGSVRGSGNRVRVTAHLTYAEDGRRIWSERWDRTADDLFAVQDELVAVIVSRVSPEIDAHEKRLLATRPTDVLSPHQLSLRANQLVSDGLITQYDEAEALMEQAIQLEPKNAQAYVQKALVIYLKMNSGAWPPRETGLRALDSARQAVSLDSRMANGFGILAAIHGVLGQTDRALDAANRTAELNPHAWGAPHGKAIAHAFAPPAWVRDPAQHAQELLDQSRLTLRMAPNTAFRSGHHFYVGLGLLMRDQADDLSEAVAELDRSATEPGAAWWPSILLAVAEVRRGNDTEAHRRVADALVVYPGLTFEKVDALFGATFVYHTWRQQFERLPELGLPIEA